MNLSLNCTKQIANGIIFPSATALEISGERSYEDGGKEKEKVRENLDNPKLTVVIEIMIGFEKVGMRKREKVI